MARWKTDEISVAGRRIRIADGAATQTVNVCTAENELGRYETKIRLGPPFVTAREFAEQHFGSVDELVDYVVNERNGVPEFSGRRPPGLAESSETDTRGDRSPTPFERWAARWIGLATCSGPLLDDAEGRIARLLELWHEPIPGAWMRSVDRQLFGRRYRRRDWQSPQPGEHALEAAVLADPIGDVECLGETLVDGVNALPLTTDSGGGRRGNVEADLLLLLRREVGYRLVVVEVKDSSNNAWYATVENLRQLKLALASDQARRVHHGRNPSLNLPEHLPMTGLVLAPARFYVEPGSKVNSVSPARSLLDQFRARTDAESYLATWDGRARRIRLLG